MSQTPTKSPSPQAPGPSPQVHASQLASLMQLHCRFLTSLYSPVSSVPCVHMPSLFNAFNQAKLAFSFEKHYSISDARGWLLTNAAIQTTSRIPLQRLRVEPRVGLHSTDYKHKLLTPPTLPSSRDQSIHSGPSSVTKSSGAGQANRPRNSRAGTASKPRSGTKFRISSTGS